jgi:predicted  nucleic acid-binding Zn-ribbon protein
MSREQDPNVGDIGNLEVEDPRTGQRDGGQRSGSAGEPGKSPGEGGPREPDNGKRTGKKPGPGGQGPWLLVSLALLTLILVMGAWTYREVTDLNARLDTAMDRSSQRLDNLESLLSATDENLSQSADSIQGRLEEQMSEIRKLWDVSNKRNRGWIKENEQALASVEQKTTDLQKSMESLRGEVSALREDVEKAVSERGKTRTQVEMLAETLQQLEEADARYEKQLKDLQALRDQWQNLDQRLKDINEAIDAFDAYRRQVNQRLEKLEDSGAPSGS